MPDSDLTKSLVLDVIATAVVYLFSLVTDNSFLATPPKTPLKK